MLNKLKSAADAARTKAWETLEGYELDASKLTERVKDAADAAREKAADMRAQFRGSKDMSAADAYNLGLVDMRVGVERLAEDGYIDPDSLRAIRILQQTLVENSDFR